MTVLIARLSTADAGFDDKLDALVRWEAGKHESVEQTVAEILSEVRSRGDEAVIEYTRRFDRRSVNTMSELTLGADTLQAALASIPTEQRQALQIAAERIRRYHEHQLQESWRYTEADGTQLGQKITPMDRVGMYVPGGKAAYPSSVLMTAIPAKVAGVRELVMVSPAPEGNVNASVLAAAAIAGVDTVISIGGAQAVAAMAYGTQTVPRVDKIVGPGNIFVATAKRAVFGEVDIDMIAGPSEILVICDGHTDPDWVAMDLFSQAEHDEDAQSILISPDSRYLDAVQASIERLLPTLTREQIARQSLAKRGALIQVRSLEEAAEIANRIAPEHLELSVADPEALLSLIRHAGAIFMGRYSSEALGDYCAGPNHVLPTSGTARFSSPLGVYDYQKRSSILYFSEEGARALGPTTAILARAESLEAHARSAEMRLQPESKLKK